MGVVRYSFQRDAAARIVGILLLIGSAVEQIGFMASDAPSDLW
jgi:hypothetical protein